MITEAPSKKQLDRWHELWLAHRDSLVPDRKSGKQLLDYLSALYPLEETEDPELLAVVSENITANSFFADKLPEGAQPEPRVFFILREGNGDRLYRERDGVLAGVERIFVGVDTVSGCYVTEGSRRLWDELCAYQGLDAADLGNFVRTGQCLECRADRRRMIGMTVTVTVDRPLGSAHPKHPDMIYPVNYGFVEGIAAPDGDWQDAYILGVDRPVESFAGRIVAIVARADDIEEKWVTAPDGCSLSREEIEEQIRFQEQYFESAVIV